MSIDPETAPIIVDQNDLRDLIEERDRLDNQVVLSNKILKNVELFLTFWYEETTEFGKIKDAFNDLDDPPCEMRIVDGRVKIKINNNEENSSSN